MAAFIVDLSLKMTDMKMQDMFQVGLNRPAWNRLRFSSAAL